jgi:hypothetical protein
MQFSALLRDYQLIDIVSVHETHYALARSPVPVPGCVTITPEQLPSRLHELLAHGFSQRQKVPYASLAGVSAWHLYTYSLEALPPSRKQVFSHALMGVGGKPGLLASWGGKKLGRSALLVPLPNEANVLAFFARWSVPYTSEVVLRG